MDEQSADTPTRLWSAEGRREIPLFKVFMPESVMAPLRDVLFSGYIGEGLRVEQFEKGIAALVGNSNVLALNSGTAALHLALRLAGVSPGDEVISTPVTCLATNSPVMATGAKIVWADIDPWTGNINPDDVVKKITPQTKAILCVHWGGYPCDLDELNTIAAEHKIKLIEDASHALGATYHGKPIGLHSDYVCFSFQAIKVITTVDGGALVCKSQEDCERGRRLRWYGMDRRRAYKDCRCEKDVTEYGYKFHMNDVTAAIGLEQLKFARKNVAKHRAHSGLFNKAFQGLQSVRRLKYKGDRTSSYWLYTLRAAHRQSFMVHMKKARINVSKVHTRNDTQPMFKEFRTALPGVDAFTSEHVAIPVGWWVTDQEVRYITDVVIDYDTSTCA